MVTFNDTCQRVQPTKKQLFHHDLGLKGCLDKETFFSGSVDTFFGFDGT